MKKNDAIKITSTQLRMMLIILFILLTPSSLFIGVNQAVSFSALISGNKEALNIFIISRLPRTLAIIVTATGLSIAGLLMQAIGRNKFLSPSTTGTTSAASLGVLIAYIIFPHHSRLTQVFFAFCFCVIINTYNHTSTFKD